MWTQSLPFIKSVQKNLKHLNFKFIDSSPTLQIFLWFFHKLSGRMQFLLFIALQTDLHLLNLSYYYSILIHQIFEYTDYIWNLDHGKYPFRQWEKSGSFIFLCHEGENQLWFFLVKHNFVSDISNENKKDIFA